MEIEKKKLFEQEKELMLKYKRFQSEQKPAQMLLEETNQRLESFFKEGDVTVGKCLSNSTKTNSRRA